MKRGIAVLVILASLCLPSFAASGNYSNVQQALTTSAQVKTVLGNFYGYAIYNPNASAVWVTYYNQTTVPTIGSTTNLIFEVGIPAGSTINVSFDDGIVFSSGLYVAVATSATGSTAPSTGVTITTTYR
jgi:hypothetical protein